MDHPWIVEFLVKERIKALQLEAARHRLVSLALRTAPRRQAQAPVRQTPVLDSARSDHDATLVLPMIDELEAFR